jgi:hypothetical protein
MKQKIGLVSAGETSFCADAISLKKRNQDDKHDNRFPLAPLNRTIAVDLNARFQSKIP